MKKKRIRVLHEDGHLLVVEKPAGVPVLGDSRKDPDLLSILKTQFGGQGRNKGGDIRPLHRLDRPTGGVMVFAKTGEAAAKMAKLIRERKVRKTYLAIVEGKPDPDAGRLQHWLKKDERKNTVQVCDKGKPGAQLAQLEYKVTDAGETTSLVKINLLTGRPHQARVQMAAMGHPILGDDKYGGLPITNAPGVLALWALRLTFQHPISRKKIDCWSNPPEQIPWAIFSAKGRKSAGKARPVEITEEEYPEPEQKRRLIL